MKVISIASLVVLASSASAFVPSTAPLRTWCVFSLSLLPKYIKIHHFTVPVVAVFFGREEVDIYASSERVGGHHVLIYATTAPFLP
mmetsp:Transcript_11885/g.18843  ORF Transcript_11885/g.18843 Transcript_11885/m.18843 type:complete len:86 (+) Transcript_11885:472-729(+)